MNSMIEMTEGEGVAFTFSNNKIKPTNHDLLASVFTFFRVFSWSFNLSREFYVPLSPARMIDLVFSLNDTQMTAAAP